MDSVMIIILFQSLILLVIPSGSKETSMFLLKISTFYVSLFFSLLLKKIEEFQSCDKRINYVQGGSNEQFYYHPVNYHTWKRVIFCNT